MRLLPNPPMRCLYLVLVLALAGPAALALPNDPDAILGMLANEDQDVFTVADFKNPERRNGNDFTGATFFPRGQKWEGCGDLREADFRNLILAGVKMWNVDCTGADFRGLDLRRTVLKEVVVQDAKFAGAKLLLSNRLALLFHGADLEGALWFETAEDLDPVRVEGAPEAAMEAEAKAPAPEESRPAPGPGPAGGPMDLGPEEPRKSRKRNREPHGAVPAPELGDSRLPAAANAEPAPAAKRPRRKERQPAGPVLGMRPDGSFIQDPAWIRDTPDLSGVAFLPGVTVSGIVFTGKTLDLTDLGLVHWPGAVFDEVDLTRAILKGIQCPGATVARAKVRREDLAVLRDGGAILREEDLWIVDGAADPLDFLDDPRHWTDRDLAAKGLTLAKNRYKSFKTAKAHFLRSGRSTWSERTKLAAMNLGRFLHGQRAYQRFERAPEWKEALLSLPGMATFLKVEAAVPPPAPADVEGALEGKSAVPLAILADGSFLLNQTQIKAGLHLAGTIFRPDAPLERVDFSRMDMDRVDLGLTRCDEASFRGRNLCTAILKGMRCRGADLRECTLRAEDEAWLREAGAILDGATFVPGLADPLAFLDENPKTDLKVSKRGTRHRFYRILKALAVRNPALDLEKIPFRKRIAGMVFRQSFINMRRSKAFSMDAQWQGFLRTIPSVGALFDQPVGRNGRKSKRPAPAPEPGPEPMNIHQDVLAIPDDDGPASPAAEPGPQVVVAHLVNATPTDLSLRQLSGQELMVLVDPRDRDRDDGDAVVEVRFPRQGTIAFALAARSTGFGEARYQLLQAGRPVGEVRFRRAPWSPSPIIWAWAAHPAWQVEPSDRAGACASFEVRPGLAAP